MTRVLILGFSLAASAFVSPGNAATDCASCHARIVEAYQRSGMSRSLYKPSPANTIEDYRNRHDFLHSSSGTYYSMIVRDGTYLQRRWQIGFDGRETNVEELTIDAVLGSGSHARAYQHRTASGGYVELPLGWYAEKGGYWAMSPGFNTEHPQTRRFVSYECIFCHDAYPRIPPNDEAPGSDPVFAGALPEGISCQRCHGPGDKHATLAHTAGATLEDIRASIVNPARLSPALRMDVCMQCHLQPTSGAIPAIIRRFNRGPFSFVPGEPLPDFQLVFDHAPGAGHDDKFEIVNSSAYRLRKSACFQKSNGALTCTTCHDPHQNQPENYSAVCRQCHASVIDGAIAAGRHPAGSDCVICHVQKRRTEDVVHVVMTDHWIQRRLPPGNPLAELPERHGAIAEYSGEVVPYYPSPLPQTAENALYQAIARGAPADLARELRRVRPREAEFYIVLGQAWQRVGKLPEAIRAYEQAVRMRPNSSRALLGLAGAQRASGELALAKETLARAGRAAPASAARLFQSGSVDFDRGHTAAAMEKMEKAVALDPDFSAAHTGLAAILFRAGNPDRAESELRSALRIDPYDASAYDLIGRVLAGKGQTAESLFDFENAIRLRPGYAPHLYDYALELSATGRANEARAAVEAALRADADMPAAHALLGELLSRQGDIPGAIAHLRRAAAGSDPTTAKFATQALQRLGQ